MTDATLAVRPPFHVPRRRPRGPVRLFLHRWINRPLRGFADWLDDWHVTRIFNAISSFAILLAVTAFAIDLIARAEERTVHAWSLVTTEAEGNSGKIAALEYLHSQGLFKKREPFFNIDLSGGVHLEGVRLPGAKMRDADLRDANLQYADLRNVDLKHASLIGADLRGADFSGAELRGADFIGAIVGPEKEDAAKNFASFDGADLRGVDLTRVKGLTAAVIALACIDSETGLPPALARQRPDPCPEDDQGRMIRE